GTHPRPGSRPTPAPTPASTNGGYAPFLLRTHHRERSRTMTLRPLAAPHTRRRLTPAARASVLAALAMTAAAGVVPASTAGAEPDADDTLLVSADEPFREVTHLASGSLYGIADEGVPSDDLIAPIDPHTFVQMPPHGTQQ